MLGVCRGVRLGKCSELVQFCTIEYWISWKWHIGQRHIIDKILHYHDNYMPLIKRGNLIETGNQGHVIAVIMLDFLFQANMKGRLVASYRLNFPWPVLWAPDSFRGNKFYQKMALFYLTEFYRIPCIFRISYYSISRACEVTTIWSDLGYKLFPAVDILWYQVLNINLIIGLLCIYLHIFFFFWRIH